MESPPGAQGPPARRNMIDGIMEGRDPDIERFERIATRSRDVSEVSDDEEDDDEDDEDESVISGRANVESVAGADPLDVDEDYFEQVDRIPRNTAKVVVHPPKRPWKYRTYDERLQEVLEKFNQGGTTFFIVLRRDGRKVKLSASKLKATPEGRRLLASDSSASDSDSSDSSDTRGTIEMGRRPAARKYVNFVDIAHLGTTDDEDELSRDLRTRARRSGTNQVKYTQAAESVSDPDGTDHVSSDADEDDSQPRHRVIRKREAKMKEPAEATRQTRVTNNARVKYDFGDPPLISDEDDDDDDERPRRRGHGRLSNKRKREPSPDYDVRRSGRQRQSKTMRELNENEIDEVEVQRSAGPAARGAREVFKTLDAQDEFRKRHCMTCDTCSIAGNSQERGALIFCQSCTLSYHQKCLGHRTSRDHLVTKVGEDHSVLQCRRCIEHARKKEKTAPHHGRCGACKKPGQASKPFRKRKTPGEEQKERESNDGQDPTYHVDPDLINNAKNIMFRCQTCFQAFHLHHLPPKQENPLESDNRSQKASHRFAEYSETWECHDCDARPTVPYGRGTKAVPGALIAWRPIATAAYSSGQTVDQVDEDDKEYLIKWQTMSHYRCLWKSGPWVWGVAPPSMRRAFFQRENNLPTMTTEDAIPEDWLRIDIVFSVKYNNFVSAKIEEVDIARIKEVGRVYAKFKGLSYEDSVWTDPPDVEEKERYEDFRAAYIDYVRGQYIRLPRPSKLTQDLGKLRPSSTGASLETIFEKKVLYREQPTDLTGGKLMDYQLEGVNWMLFQWFKERNAILADEMGLGKTIQVVGFLTALQEKVHLAPFLVVVPNATCANWRRELKQWAPSLRVVTYFGSAKAKELSMEYELFGDRSDKPSRSLPAAHDLRCHVVVTSYDAAAEPENQAFFKRINWQALIIDEGQRLKNDKTNLYTSLLSLKTPFRMLLTGTPLQNNQRELFNLLQFLDKTVNAEQLEKEYENLDQDLVKKLHELIKPFFLRRTKAQVLDFLPPMGQVIVPVTMTRLQRELYKNILSKNAELVKAVMGKRDADKGKAISGLKNVLMQLRKVLCHPFVYSVDVEERTRDQAVSHKRLVAASAKLILLELMLPKLKERGHRVLIFSQFLDNLTIVEDFLDGTQLPHLRLDGTQGSLQKQKVIDKFNAPNSEYFCMLLSTRAGGVGINLATADTVIILDPDFNPHQDIQAISRAHRIGQKNKVLVFKLMTRDSAEERIMQVGKKKMVLDHVIIEQMENDEGDGSDLSTILAFGAKALFEDQVTDITYDDTSIDKLLDRSQIENTKSGTAGGDQEMQFSFARIWQNDAAAMREQPAVDTREGSADSALWDQILEHRAKEAEEEKKRKEAMLGRGRRNRSTVNYGQDTVQQEDDSDTDFAAKDGDSEDDRDSQMSGAEDASVQEAVRDALGFNGPAPPRAPPIGSMPPAPAAAQPVMQPPTAALPTGTFGPPHRPKPTPSSRSFVRANPVPPTHPPPLESQHPCLACKNAYGAHVLGDCPLKKAGPEYCNLCGMAHFGYQRTCLHLNSETQVRLMLEALKNSPEDTELVRQARFKLQGIKGTIVQKKKKKAEQESQQHQASGFPQRGGMDTPVTGMTHQQLQTSGMNKFDAGQRPAMKVSADSVFTAGWNPLGPQHRTHSYPMSTYPTHQAGPGFGQPPQAASPSHQPPGGYVPWGQAEQQPKDQGK